MCGDRLPCTLPGEGLYFFEVERFGVPGFRVERRQTAKNSVFPSFIKAMHAFMIPRRGARKCL